MGHALLIYMLGVITLPALLLLWAIFITPMRTRHPRSEERGNKYVHQVGEGQDDLHEHIYSTYLPAFIRRSKFKRDATKCVYFHLGKTPEQVVDAELDHIIQNDISPTEHTDVVSVYDTAENMLVTRYQAAITLPRPEFVQTIAKAQLDRLKTR